MLSKVTTACLFASAFSCLIASAQVARADSLDEGYFGAKLMLGIGGKAKLETTVAGVTGSGDTDLDPSYGGALEYMYPLHQYFVLGGMASLASWQTGTGNDNNADRNLLLDIDVVPQLRYPVTDSIELSLGVPLGLTLDFWGGNGASVGNVASADVNTGVGFNIGALAGIRVVLVDGFGILAELGYQLHSFTHEAQATVLGNTASQDLDLSLGQFVVNLGVFLF